MNRLLRTVLAAVAASLAWPAAGRAQVAFSYPNFASTAGLQLNGVAAAVGGELRLSTATSFSSGSAFTTAAVPLGNLSSFSTFFQFRITNSGGIGDGDGAGADGLVFVVQTVSNNVGVSGGSIGYGGIGRSIGVEFDTYDNGGGYGDPNGNHVGFDRGGTIASVVAVVEPTRFNNGGVWNAWVDYNGATQTLEARWSQTGTRPAAAQLTAVDNIQTSLMQNTAYVGFTSATGSGWGNHDILSWQFRAEYAPIPEPASCGLLAMATGSVAALRLRARRAGPVA